jgi:hypothetical protein
MEINHKLTEQRMESMLEQQRVRELRQHEKMQNKTRHTLEKKSLQSELFQK